jgi:hypothetical protein
MISERGINPLHADSPRPCGPIESEASQVSEHRVGSFVMHIELDRVTVRPGADRNMTLDLEEDARAFIARQGFDVCCSRPVSTAGRAVSMGCALKLIEPVSR